MCGDNHRLENHEGQQTHVLRDRSIAIPECHICLRERLYLSECLVVDIALR
jgi:hypothetical protein